MNGSHIAIPTILKVGKGTLKDIGSYIKDSRIENAVVYFGNGLVDMFGDTVLQSFQKENINVLEYKELDSIKIENIIDISNLEFNEYDKILVLYENEERVSIKDEIEKIKNSNKENLEIGIIIGPEGGLDDTEIEKLKLKSNVSVVTLGKRILRTETVALVVSGILMYELGDLN